MGRHRAAFFIMMACVAAIVFTGCSTSAADKSVPIITPGNPYNDSVVRGDANGKRDDCAGIAITFQASQALSGTPQTELTYKVSNVRAVIVGEAGVAPGSNASNQMTAALTEEQSRQVAHTGRLTIKLEDFWPSIESLDWLTACP